MEELNTLTGASEGTTYPDHIITLKNIFKTAIGNDDFVKDVKKVEKAIAALTLVDPETRVRAQLETNAYKTLRGDRELCRTNTFRNHCLHRGRCKGMAR